MCVFFFFLKSSCFWAERCTYDDFSDQLHVSFLSRYVCTRTKAGNRNSIVILTAHSEHIVTTLRNNGMERQEHIKPETAITGTKHGLQRKERTNGGQVGRQGGKGCAESGRKGNQGGRGRFRRSAMACLCVRFLFTYHVRFFLFRKVCGGTRLFGSQILVQPMSVEQ